MRRMLRVLALSLYAAVTLGGAGLHLLEHVPEDDCPGCGEENRRPSLFGQCDEGPLPCRAPSHTHHTHPVHHNEGGCVTCSFLSSPHAGAPTPIEAGIPEAVPIPPPAASFVPTPLAVPRPPDRAPPAR